MRAIRTVVGALGATALALAGGTLVAPDLTSGLDVTARFGNDYLFVVPIGLLTVVVVVGVVTRRTVQGVDQARPPDPEGVPTADAPGAEFDRLVDGGWRTAIGARRYREWLRNHLREAAIRTVMRTERCSREAARRRVEAGTWTDDPVAAAFVVEDGPRSRDAIQEAVEAIRRREVPLQWRARHTALAIDRAGREGPT